MNCNKFKDEFSAYQDSNMKPELFREFEEHVSSCDVCKKKLELYETIKEISKSLRSIEAPYYLESKTINYLKENKELGYFQILINKLTIKSISNSIALPIITIFAFLISISLNLYFSPMKVDESFVINKDYESSSDIESYSLDDFGLIIFATSQDDEKLIEEKNSSNNLAMLLNTQKSESRNIFDSLTFYSDKSKKTIVESNFDW